MRSSFSTDHLQTSLCTPPLHTYMHIHLQNEAMKPSFSAVINEDATLEIVSPREVAFHFKVGSTHSQERSSRLYRYTSWVCVWCVCEVAPVQSCVVAMLGMP